MAKYTLKELAEKSGLPGRTIRFYITRKVLAGAEGRGRRAHYTEEHLDRLRTLRGCLERGQPLSSLEITPTWTVTQTCGPGPPITITSMWPMTYDLGHGVLITLTIASPLSSKKEARLLKALRKATNKTYKKMQKEN